MAHATIVSASTLALHGGTPVRTTLLPYSRQRIDEADVRAVSDALRSDWLTTGPLVSEFERAFSGFVGSIEAVAVSSGTAALHAAMEALGIGAGDEVIVPAMTFAATANAVVFQGGIPVFCDVRPDTLLIVPEEVEAKITGRTKAVIAVDYAGQPCEYDALRAIAGRHNLMLVADACHALGGSYRGSSVGLLADISAFSFHPVKPMTTGEGGMVTTDRADLAARMRRFRNHFMTFDHRERGERGSWFYEVAGLGFNYRLTDIQCALGLSQLNKVPLWTERRQEIAKRYDAAFAQLDAVAPLRVRDGVSHAYHLYAVRLDPDRLSATRAEIFSALRAENIGVNVHYLPVHLHPFYRERFGTKTGLCPVAEAAYDNIISLPIFAGMSDRDADDVMEAVLKVCRHFAR